LPVFKQAENDVDKFAHQSANDDHFCFFAFREPPGSTPKTRKARTGSSNTLTGAMVNWSP